MNPTRNPHFWQFTNKKNAPKIHHTPKKRWNIMFLQVKEFYLNLKRHETPLSLLFIRARPDDATALLPHLAAGAVSRKGLRPTAVLPGRPSSASPRPLSAPPARRSSSRFQYKGHGLPAHGGRQGF